MNPIAPLRQKAEVALTCVKNRDQLGALTALGCLSQCCVKAFGTTSVLDATLQLLDQVQGAIKQGDFDTAYQPLLAIVAKLRSVEQYLDEVEEDHEIPRGPWTPVRKASEAAYRACQDRDQNQTLSTIDKLEVWLIEVFKPAEALYATFEFLENLRVKVKAGDFLNAETGLLAFARKMQSLEQEFSR